MYTAINTYLIHCKTEGVCFSIIHSEYRQCFLILQSVLSLALGPHFAAVNQNNEIIVTDFHNHSVKVCDHRENCEIRVLFVLYENVELG